MKKITSIAELTESIQLLETRHEYEGTLLKEQFITSYKSLKPVNILRSTFKEVISAPDLKTKVINAALSFGTGFITRKIFIGRSHNIFTKLLGSILEVVVANKVAKNADTITSIGSKLLKKF